MESHNFSLLKRQDGKFYYNKYSKMILSCKLSSFSDLLHRLRLLPRFSFALSFILVDIALRKHNSMCLFRSHNTNINFSFRGGLKLCKVASLRVINIQFSVIFKSFSRFHIFKFRYFFKFTIVVF